MSRTTNKVHLRVAKDGMNNWFKHENSPTFKFPTGYKLQLKGDTRLGPTFLEQCAIDCELPKFMEDFDKILTYAEMHGLSLFTLYVAEKESTDTSIFKN